MFMRLVQKVSSKAIIILLILIVTSKLGASPNDLLFSYGSFGKFYMLSDTITQVWKVPPEVQECWTKKYLKPKVITPVIICTTSLGISIWAKGKADAAFRKYERAVDPVTIEKRYSEVNKFDKISNLSLISFELSATWIVYQLLKISK